MLTKTCQHSEKQKAAVTSSRNKPKEETAVCNLGSINLAAHTTKDGIDQKIIKETILTAVRMLDNVIDINFNQ